MQFLRSNKQTNKNDLIEKDGGTKNISIYKDWWSGIQGLVSAYWLLLLLLFNKTSSSCPSRKNKIVKKLLSQPHQHLYQEKLKNKLREVINDWLFP